MAYKTETKIVKNQYSYWEKEYIFKNYDVLVIGAGLVGLCAAIELKKISPKLKIVVLERGTLPMGASTKNAGFACFGSISEHLKELKTCSEEQLLSLIEQRWNGLVNLQKLLGNKAIAYEPLGGFDVFLKNENERFEEAENNINRFNKLLKPIVGITDIYAVADEKIASNGLAKTSHIIHNKAEGQLNTGLMMRALIEKAQKMGVAIFNGVDIISIEQEPNHVRLRTEHNTWEAKQVLVATNGFAKNLIPFLDITPARGQVLVTNKITGLKLTGSFHHDGGYNYFRNIDGRVLIGGGRQLNFKGEQTQEFGETVSVRNYLEKLLTEVVIPNNSYTIEYSWSGIMGFGPQLHPIVEAFSQRLFCAVRCNGMGVAMGSLTGKRAAKLVADYL